MKKGRVSIILILVILLFIGAAIYFLYENGIFNFIKVDDGKVVFESNDLFLVTKNEDKFGINKTDGNVILECQYNTLLRNDNSVYIKDENGSYVFFLNNNKSISLGGKENDVMLAYDKTSGRPLPYFILVYGTGDSSIYRIYTIEGVRYSNKDFTDLSLVYEFLDAKIQVTSKQAPKAVTDSYSVKEQLDYLSSQSKHQYVVSDKEEKNKKYGIVDENGRIILDVACDSLTRMPGKENGVIAEKNGRKYVFMQNEKLIEIDPGFELSSDFGVLFQKKGNTVNKLYNLNGEVVVDGIYDYSTDFITYRTDNSTYVFVKQDGNYSLYNITSNKKYDTTYSEIISEYMKDYKDSQVWETGYLYMSGGVPYCIDFKTMKASRINVTANIHSILDIGYKYKI